MRGYRPPRWTKLEQLRARADFESQIAVKIDELISAVRDVDAAAVPESVAQSVDQLLQRHSERLDLTLGSLEDVAKRLEDAVSRIPSAHPTSDTTTEVIRETGGPTAPDETADRVSLIAVLRRLDPVDLNQIIAAVGGTRYVSESAPPGQRVADLVGWAETASGPGLGQVYATAKELVPNLVLRSSPQSGLSTAGETTGPGPPAGALPAVWNVPHQRNRNFTGREGLLDDLRAALTSGRPAAVTQAISGLGGVGKSQLALEYAYRHASEYQVVWWIRSEEAAGLASDYAGLAVELGLKEAGASDQRLVREAVRRWLEQNDGWLLVFDNAPGQPEVESYLPRGTTGHVLVTSRNRVWRGAASLPVEVFDRSESVEFLLRRTGERDEKAAHALAGAVGDLPLAMEQAVTYIEETGRTISGYLALFRQRERELLAEGQTSTEYPHSVAATWGISFQKVEEASPPAADFLRLIAFLAPDDVPRVLVSEGAEHLPEPLRSAVSDPLAVDQALATLRRYSLVEIADESISLHRLVQAVVRDRLAEDDRSRWAEAAVALLTSAYPYQENDVATWPTAARLLPHALAAAGHTEELEVTPEATGFLLYQAASYLRVRAEFAGARAVYERSLAIGEKVYGPNHSNVASIVNNLGNVLQQQGDPEGARAYYQRALAIYEEVHGPEHPSVATVVNNLGEVARGQGDLEGARTHFERALAIDEKAYDPDHPEVATDVHNLGIVLQTQGDLRRARTHYQRALAIDEKAYGRDHPNVAVIVNSLAGVLRDVGDLEEARTHYQRALAIDEKAYGPDHPSVAVVVNNLAGVLQAQGDLEGARAHFERALRIFREFLGDDHPNTVMARDNLRALDD